MTIDEFRALKPGDRIRNAMTESIGVIAAAEEYRGSVSCTVQWGGSDRQFSFGERSCAWMHWSLDHDNP